MKRLLKNIMRPMVLPLSTSVLLLMGCSHQQTREPAAMEPSMLFNEPSSQAARNIIGSDSPIANQRFPMSVNFYIDGDEKYLTENAKKAIRQAIYETLRGDTTELGLVKSLTGNLKDEFLETFVKTLRVYKIVDIGIQVDFQFSPVPNDPTSYNDQLKSNLLVLQTPSPGLSKRIADPAPTQTQKILFGSRTIDKGSKSDMTHLGGVISVYLKVLDTRLAPRLPNPKQNAVKGFIRYRQFVSGPNLPTQEVRCGNFKLKIVPEQYPMASFYTVDFYKNLNLKNIIPIDEGYEIFPGSIAPANLGRNEMVVSKNEGLGEKYASHAILIQDLSPTHRQLTYKINSIHKGAAEENFNLRKSALQLVNFKSLNPKDESHLSAIEAMNRSAREALSSCKKEISAWTHLQKIFPGVQL